MSGEPLYKTYFDESDKVKQKYGPRSVIFMLVGSFYEIYGIRYSDNTYNTNIEDVAKICNIISKKKSHLKTERYNGDIYGAGVPEHALEKFLNLVVEADYTVAIYDQVKQGNKLVRCLTNVYSKGTKLSSIETTETSNNIACIWCEKYEKLSTKTPRIVFGLSVIDILNGKTTVFEYASTYINDPTVVDELERQLTIHVPNEFIFISNLEANEEAKILHYIGLDNRYIHKYHSTDDSVKNCTKTNRINHCLERVYGSEAKKVCMELNTYSMSCQALVFLLDFVSSHNPHLVERIKPPSFAFNSGYVLLANHTLKQLNMIQDENGKGKKSSVCGFLNNCKTKSGTRLFKEYMLNPTTDSEWLNTQYHINDYYQKRFYSDMCRSEVDNISDIELILRHCLDHRCTPQMLYYLYLSLNKVVHIVTKYHPDETMKQYLEISKKDLLDSCIERIGNSIDIDKSYDINLIQQVDNNVFKKGVYPELDSLIDDYNQNVSYFDDFVNALNFQVGSFDKVDYFKVNVKDKTGSSIVITKTRADKFVKNVKSFKFRGNWIPLDDIRLETVGKSIEVRYGPLQSSILKTQQLKDECIAKIKSCFVDFVNQLIQDYHENIRDAAKIVSKLDVLQTRIYNAFKYNYCLPKLVDNERSFLRAKDMRHALIEQLQEDEIYVPNDIELGLDTNGILLYGTNAVGKTSFIRSIGICVILAQSGCYVPCSSFEYCPYTSIFSRILGNDNIFKGLSTFAVEMSELRVITNYANEKSLILGDELCSGTEIQSALSLFTTGLEHISNRQSSYIFATHFHEVLGFSEIDAINGLKIKHMDVYYDNASRALVYNRKLCDGPGSKTYGLEVCKSMFMDDEFLERAYQIRKKYFDNKYNMLGAKPSTYNAKKLKDKCEICGNPADDIHHMMEQNKADEKQFIHHFHKNHKANLMSICKECHDKIHEEGIVYERKKTTKGYIFVEKRSQNLE